MSLSITTLHDMCFLFLFMPQSPESQPPFATTVPSFAYVLASQPASAPLPWQGEDPAIPELMKQPLAPFDSSSPSREQCAAIRVDLYSRVVHCQPEVQPYHEYVNIRLLL